MKQLTPFVFAFLLQAASAGEEVRPVISQKEVGENACGPCAYVNSLLRSNDEALLNSLEGETPEDKARSFGERFGHVASVYDGKPETAYSAEDGVTDRDLLAMVNKMRSGSGRGRVSGNYLLREADEKPTAFLQKVEGTISRSISSGFYPLLDIRSSKVVKEGDGVLRWNKIAGHWVCVVGVDFVAEDLLVLRVADSDGGKISSLVLHCDVPNGAVVPMSPSYDRNGKLRWEWEKSGSCLFVCAPSVSVGRGETKWFERSYLAACYLIADDKGRGPATATESKSESGKNEPQEPSQ